MTMNDRAHERSLFLSATQRELLTAVVDRLIPPGEGVPGAGDVGVAHHVEGICGVALQTRALLSKGLKAIESSSGRSHSMGFVSLSEDERTAVLRQVESEHGEFFAVLVRETYSGYYSSREVLMAKGLPFSAPQTEGYDIEPFDESLLEGVRKRGKAYRDA